MLQRPGKNQKEKRAGSKRKRKKHKKRPTVERQHVVCEDSGDSGCDDETELMTAAVAKANADSCISSEFTEIGLTGSYVWYDYGGHWFWFERRAVEEVD